MSSNPMPGCIAIHRYQTARDCSLSLLEWFSLAAEKAWQSPQPFLVLVPTFSVSIWIRRLLLDHEQSCLGIRFVTPGELRQLLMRNFCFPRKLCGDAEIDLLASSVAAIRPDVRDRAIGADPSLLRTLLETLAPTSGDISDMLSNHGLKSLYGRLQYALKEQEIIPSWDADRELLRLSAATPPWIAALLVFGFHGAHWPLRHLIQSTIHCSEKSLLYLEEPRDDEHGGQLDRTWIDTWEEFSGQSGKFVDKGESDRDSNMQFAVGKDIHAQAQAVTTIVAKWLTDGALRIGVLVPQSGFLSDEINRLFSSRNFAFYDGVGSLLPGETTNAEWRAWLELQRNPTLGHFLVFLKARGLESDEVTRLFDHAWRNVLSDDLHLIRHWLESQGREVKAFPSLLPETATVAEMLAHTERIFSSLGWKTRLARLQSHQGIFAKRDKLKIDRMGWCRWLQKSMETFSLKREKNAAEPYARLYLLRYEDALSQEWTHLVFAGMNEGAEPGRDVAFPFLDADEAAKLNAKIRARNRASIRESRHGAGSEILIEGEALCIGSDERRQIGKKTLRALLESADHICITASLHAEEKASLHLRPSDFFADLWMEHHHSVLADEDFLSLSEETHEWTSGLYSQPVTETFPTVTEARVARTNPLQPFGRYEFAFDGKPLKPAHLACDRWEKAYNDPAPIWLRYYLGIQPAPDFEEVPWNMVMGEWTHRWLDALHSEGANWEVFPNSEQRLERLEKAAATFRSLVFRTCEEIERAVPFWWESAFNASVNLARTLSSKLDAIPDGWKFTSEYAVKNPVAVNISDKGALQLYGRMDMVVGNGGKGMDIPCAVVADYKTGRSRPLTLSSLRRGEGIQVALYGMLVHAMGAREVSSGYIVPEHPFALDQLTCEDIGQTANIWETLLSMQETGVFGMRREVRAEYARVQPLPVATLRVADEILRFKWELTHPGGSDE